MSDELLTRTIAVGDVHGCIDELRELLDDVVKYVPSQDTLVFCGDYVDRGSDSAGVLRYLEELEEVPNAKVSFVIGNHDERYIRFAKHMDSLAKNPKYKVPMKLDSNKMAVYASLNRKDIQFLERMPVYLELKVNKRPWVIVHAGLEPGVVMNMQSTGSMTHLRYLDPKTGKPAKLDEHFNPPPGSVYWTEVFDLPFNVVYGHMVHSLERPRIDRTPDGRVCVGLDTGACFGGHLSALVLETGELFQVKAKKAYCPLHNSHLY